jgi:hypothetical protein
VTTYSPKRGEVWRVNHQRKGAFSVLLLEDVIAGAEWIKTELHKGRPVTHGHTREPGERMTLRASFTEFLERIDPPAQAPDQDTKETNEKPSN